MSAAVKQAVRARDHFCCLHCGMTQAQHYAIYGKDFDIHRTSPGSAYSVDPGVCETLCRPCHAAADKRLRDLVRKPKPVLSRLVLMIDEDIRDAIRIEAILSRQNMGQVLECLIREHCSEAMQMYRERHQSPPSPS